MAVEKSAAVTFKGGPLTLVGAEIKVGDKAPDFTVLANDLSEVTLGTDAEKARLLVSAPSLDTPVCDAEAKRFNDEAANFGDQVVVYTISCDLPFAQARWCGASNAENIKTLSDHRSVSFGEAYGTHIKELRLLSRAIFLVDADNVVRYVEYVPEVTEHPNYDAALQAVKSL